MSRLGGFKAKKTTEESQKGWEIIVGFGFFAVNCVFVSFYRKKNAGLDLD